MKDFSLDYEVVWNGGPLLPPRDSDPRGVLTYYQGERTMRELSEIGMQKRPNYGKGFYVMGSKRKTRILAKSGHNSKLISGSLDTGANYVQSEGVDRASQTTAAAGGDGGQFTEHLQDAPDNTSRDTTEAVCQTERRT